MPASTGLAAAVLIAAGFAAYAGSLAAPFIFDDLPAIVHNPSIRHFATAWLPPATDGSGVAGRPLVNVSLALNYAVGGLDVRGYHVFNLGVQLLAGLTLFGIVKRTVTPAVGWAVALLWLVHPLLTESVTCVIQRTECLAALFMLLALYCSIRNWKGTAVAACACGLLTKETAVVTPVLLLLYDFAFQPAVPRAGANLAVAISPEGAGPMSETTGNARAAQRTSADDSSGAGVGWFSAFRGSRTAGLRARGSFYAALGSTWVLLLWLQLAGGAHRGAAAGFGLGVSWWCYLLTQAKAIALYLKLAVWPHPLVLDYGDGVVTSISAVLLPGLLILLLLVGSLYAFFRTTRHRAAGFLGVAFFVLLAPSSSVVPLVTQTSAEHRMYLPLAVVLTGLVAALSRWGGERVMIELSIFGAVVLGGMTLARNARYRSAVDIWEDTVVHAPANPRAHNDLGLALAAAGGRAPEATSEYERALRLRPNYPEAHNNLAILLDAAGDSDGAIVHYRRALAARPAYPEAWEGLGVALARVHRPADAEAAFRDALALRPDSPEAHYNLGEQLEQIPSRADEAAREYQRAIELQPDYADARYNLANLLAGIPGRAPEAIAQYREVLRLTPGNADAHNNLAVAYAATGQVARAIEQCQAALRLRPDFAGAKANLEKLQGRR